jgi:hypothetical protein
MAEGSATSNSTVIWPGPEVRGEASLLIGDFDSVMKTSEVGDVLESKPFMVGNASFTIDVFPNGDLENEGKVGVSLQSNINKDVVVRRCKMTVGEESKESKKDIIVKANKACGWGSWFNTQDECRAALQDGNLMVKAEVELLGNEVVVDMHPGDGKKVGNNWVLKNLFKRRSESDISLICDGQAVPVHSLVLTGASPYFESLLKPCWGGQEKDGIKFDCTPEVGEAFVEFIYTDKIEEVVLDENLSAFLKIGNFTMMEELQLLVEPRMIRLLDRENMVGFFIAGEKYNGQRIREKAKEFVRANLRWLRGQAGWKEAFGAEKDLIIEILE